MIFAFLLLTTIASSDTLPPASIHLELGKDTLALAEPTVLTVEITNNSASDLLVDNATMFTLNETPYRFSLTLITPDGQEWLYDPLYKMDVLYAPSAKLYFSLESRQAASDNMLLWWTCFLPDTYQVALEKLPSGIYKLFATYRLPKQKDSEVSILYSDTFEFVFLPVQEEHIPVLIEMDSMHFYLNGGLKRGLKDEIYQRLARIKDSQSPYSEAAHVRLAYTFGSIDDLRMKKERFDRMYPNSAFEPFLMKRQFIEARAKGLSNEMDSLLDIFTELSSTNHIILKEQNKIKTYTAEESMVR